MDVVELRFECLHGRHSHYVDYGPIHIFRHFIDNVLQSFNSSSEQTYDSIDIFSWLLYGTNNRKMSFRFSILTRQHVNTLPGQRRLSMLFEC
jgi:hypothetical protein